MGLIIGVDDAGRGPIIGPMALAGVLVNSEQDSKLKAEGVKDSKALTQLERERLAKIIEGESENSQVLLVPADEIDASLKSGVNLNKLEAIKIAEVINILNSPDLHKKKIEVVVDCPSVNTGAWSATLLEFIDYDKNLRISCEHKADVNHASVSAASILAKVAREEEVSKIRKKHGEVGSGYPSDPLTKKFLKEKGSELGESGLIRKTWATWKRHVAGKKQKSLSEY